MPQTVLNDAQVEFDKKYITASQIMKDMRISRAGLLHARRAGKLPEPVVLNEGRLFIWERAKVQAILDNWKLDLTTRREA